MTMKIVVDRDLCEVQGMCQRAAPEVFRVDIEADVMNLLVEHLGEELRAKVELAVRRCPRRALKLVEE